VARINQCPNASERGWVSAGDGMMMLRVGEWIETSGGERKSSSSSQWTGRIYELLLKVQQRGEDGGDAL
jgi:hypothetical protein